MLNLILTVKLFVGVLLVIVGLLNLVFRIQITSGITWPDAASTSISVLAFVAVIALGVSLLK